MISDKYKVMFFAGGETDDNKFNIFTGSFIRLMKQILVDDFDFIRGVYFKLPVMNVIWALNHAQKPLRKPANKKILRTAFRQISETCHYPESQLVIVSSSSGSVVAAQTACYLAQQNISNFNLKKPFHLVLGASMISPQSDLYNQLLHYKEEGKIGIILNDEMQDEGDTSYGVGGQSRAEAYGNAFRLMVPYFSSKSKGPSFLNTNPETGHVHRRRSQTEQKAIDYVNIILIKNCLAGENYREIAQKTLENKS
jgi:hypothetical protein